MPEESGAEIGIIAALKEEAEQLIAALQQPVSEVALGKPWISGTFASHRVVVATSGIGKVAAAATTQRMIDRYRVRAVLMLGTAGSLHDKCKLDDIIISGKVTAHDLGDYRWGKISTLIQPWFNADQTLVRQALAAAHTLGIDAQVRSGTIISGDQVIKSRERRQWLHTTFSADCVEMEGAAVAQVCSLNSVPWVLIRGISDNADEHVFASFKRTLKSVAARTTALVLEMLRSEMLAQRQ